jgi:hypothetical protein
MMYFEPCSAVIFEKKLLMALTWYRLSVATPCVFMKAIKSDIGVMMILRWPSRDRRTHGRRKRSVPLVSQAEAMAKV